MQRTTRADIRTYRVSIVTHMSGVFHSLLIQLKLFNLPPTLPRRLPGSGETKRKAGRPKGLFECRGVPYPVDFYGRRNNKRKIFPRDIHGALLLDPYFSLPQNTPEPFWAYGPHSLGKGHSFLVVDFPMIGNWALKVCVKRMGNL